MPTFAEVSAITETGAGEYAADIHPEWTIAAKPNGGYLLALLGRAAVTIGAHPHVVAASAHYLRSPEPGPVAVSVRVLRAGRSASQLRAWLSQDGRPCVEALLTTSTVPPDSSPYWDAGVPDPGTTPQYESLRVPSVGATGFPAAIMDQVELRIDPATLGFATGRPSGAGELRGWLALPEDEPFDPISLLYALDAFPPATFDIEATGWVPTLELTAYVRALPAPGPIRVLQRAHLVATQRVDESCWLWDATGRPVASGVQLAAIRLG